MSDVPNVRQWLVSREELAKALHRAGEGEDPDLLLIELFANSKMVGRGESE